MSKGYYCTAAEAHTKLKERQGCGAKESVVEFWHKRSLSLPVLPAVERPAVLARQVATGRFEDILFRELALSAGLTPTWWQYTEDRFTSVSPYKRSLIHPVSGRKKLLKKLGAKRVDLSSSGTTSAARTSWGRVSSRM